MIDILTAPPLTKSAKDKLKVLICGHVGSGKTTLAGSIAECDEIAKILWITTQGDRGFESLADTPHASKVHIKRITKAEEVLQIQRALLGQDHDYDAVIIDSLSSLETTYVRWAEGAIGDDHTFSLEEKDKKAIDMQIQMWRNAKRYIQDTIYGYFALADGIRSHPIHAIFISQIRHEEMEGELSRQVVPDLRPKTIPIALSAPDHILFTFVEKEDSLDGQVTQSWKVQIKPSEMVPAKIHKNVEITSKLPTILGGTERLTLANFCKKLNIPL